MASQQRPRLLLLGLDGLPLDLARRLGRRLPNLARIAHAPQATPVHAELPELSPVNWTSIYTAAGPEEHGVFGFTRIHPATYATAVADFDQVRVPAVFDRLGEAGLRSKVLNLPNTYPARPIPGMLVSGFVACDLDKAVHPPFLAPVLRSSGYVLEADTSRAAEKPEALLERLAAALRSRERAFDMLFKDHDFDLFIVVLTETDRLFHFLYAAVEDDAHPLHPACMEFMEQWDAAVGRILDRFQELPGPKRLMAAADHGFTRLETEFDCNAWLRQAGLLHLSRPPADAWDFEAVADETSALALDPGRIYLHTAERFARGRLSNDEAARLAAEIKTALLEMRWNGEPVLEAVWTREELYPGPCFDAAPDLVCQPRPGVELKAKLDRNELFGRYARTGTHTPRGAFFYDSQGASPSRMRDIGREILVWWNDSQDQSPLIIP
jgi:predicted AlkP superfamily phosphohydrolase/phosphomutase